jgi:hypothetical protein
MSIRETIVVLVLIAGCGAGTSYVYAPEGAKLETGSLSTEFKIPPEEPKGDVRVQSNGITEIEAGGRKIPVVQIRLTVANNSDTTPWTVDTREQLLDIPRAGRATPMFANTDRGTGPVLTVPRLDQRIIDLYFPLPTGVHDAKDLENFDLLWQVHTGPRLVAERTSFDRISIEPEVTTDLYAGWGPYWWYDPYYPSYSYLYSRPYYSRPYIRSPNHIIVTRPGRGHYRSL